MDDDVAPRMAFVLHDVDDEQLLLISIENEDLQSSVFRMRRDAGVERVSANIRFR
jgi:hypothetical protein